MFLPPQACKRMAVEVAEERHYWSAKSWLRTLGTVVKLIIGPAIEVTQSTSQCHLQNPPATPEYMLCGRRCFRRRTREYGRAHPTLLQQPLRMPMHLAPGRALGCHSRRGYCSRQKLHAPCTRETRAAARSAYVMWQSGKTRPKWKVLPLVAASAHSSAKLATDF